MADSGSILRAEPTGFPDRCERQKERAKVTSGCDLCERQSPSCDCGKDCRKNGEGEGKRRPGSCPLGLVCHQEDESNLDGTVRVEHRLGGVFEREDRTWK